MLGLALAIGFGVLACIAQAKTGMTHPITVTCTAAKPAASKAGKGPASAADLTDAALLCAETIAALPQFFPGYNFRSASDGLPAMQLTVTHANARGAGLDVTWVSATGKKTAGTPLHMSFFDKPAHTAARHRLLDAFFRHNPPPF